MLRQKFIDRISGSACQRSRQLSSPSTSSMLGVLRPLHNFIAFSIIEISIIPSSMLELHIYKELLGRLPLPQRLHCAATRQIRLLEKQVYDAKVKNMK